MNLPTRRVGLVVAALAVLAIAGGLTLWGPYAARADKDRAWQRVQAAGVLRVGMDMSYPPFEYLDEHNQLAGFDVDLANEIGRRLGLEVAFVNIAYDGLYDALVTGQADVLISALVSAAEHEPRAVFSSPYFNAGEHLVVLAGSPIAVMPDLAGRSLAVEYGSGGDVEARRWQRRLAGLAVVRYPDPDSALMAVASGEADAALVDGVTARLGVGRNPELAVAASVEDVLFAVAIPPGNPTLLKRINDAIDGMMADGTLGALNEQWFGPQR